ncbi:MAG: triose-phosphate isomerase [Clostridia bacterium]|nr:triose-phosphate isomerase [Clostridia bacterium]
MRRPIIAGNWKMNKNIAETKALVSELIPLVKDAEAEVVICTPYTDLYTAVELTKGTNISVGAENVHWAESGAFTGEISASMLTEIGVKYVIIGHSERRQYFGETDETVNKRVIAALNAGLKVIVCVGETLEEKEAGKTEDVVTTQTIAAFKDVSSDKIDDIVVAYEPVWAIGTGRTATADDANATIKVIRDTLAKVFCPACSEKIRIQYGGSMNPKNAHDLMAQPEIDGGLIGGASLKAVDFSMVVKY